MHFIPVYFFFARALKGWVHVWWFDGHIVDYGSGLRTIYVDVDVDIVSALFNKELFSPMNSFNRQLQ